jgi:hypothetical protein
MIRQTAPVTACPAADRIPWETTDEGLREVTVETVPQKMYDTTPYVVRRTAFPVTSQTAAY